MTRIHTIDAAPESAQDLPRWFASLHDAEFRSAWVGLVVSRVAEDHRMQPAELHRLLVAVRSRYDHRRIKRRR